MAGRWATVRRLVCPLREAWTEHFHGASMLMNLIVEVCIGVLNQAEDAQPAVLGSTCTIAPVCAYEICELLNLASVCLVWPIQGLIDHSKWPAGAFRQSGRRHIGFQQVSTHRCL